MASLNLEVGIDASGVVKGSKDAFQALVQLTNATRHLMDGMEGLTGTNGAMGRFGMLVQRFSPHLMAATAILGATSLAMSAFGSKTNDAADSQQRLADSIARARREQELARSLGESMLPGLQAERAGVRDRLANVGNQPIGAGAFAAQNNLSQEGILRWLATRGDEEAAAALRGERILRERSGGAGMNPSVRYDTINPADLQLSPEQQKAMLEARYRSTGAAVLSEQGRESTGFNTNSLQWYRPPADPTVPTTPYAGIGPYLPGTSEDAMTRAGAGHWQTAQALKAQQEATQKQLEAMRELDQTAQQVGSTLGDAATRFVFQLSSGREILAGLLMQMTQAGLTQAATAGVRGIFGAFNAPAAQRTPGVNP